MLTRRVWIWGVVTGIYLSGLAAVHAGNAFELAGISEPDRPVPAPDFSLATLGSETASLSDYRGKVVLLNFWATWCAPCREEMPAMQSLWERLQDDGFVILAVSGDKGGRQKVAKFVEDMGLDFPILLDPAGEVSAIYDVPGLPTSYLIGRDGRLSGRVIGMIDWASDNVVAAVQRMLAD